MLIINYLCVCIMPILFPFWVIFQEKFGCDIFTTTPQDEIPVVLW